jgi:ABC-type multidrug transport system ATPase subunit
MLKTTNLSVYANRDYEKTALLKAIDFRAELGELIAIIGPSGCGKTTFLKAIAGLARHTEGQMSWLNREIAGDYDIEPEMLAYVPQFGIFHEELTVKEILTDAAILRLGQLGDSFLQTRVAEVADLTGLGELLLREAKVLSGGQKRRLALAMELVSEPSIILADEVTSGLDPKSAFEITILLRSLATAKKKIVLHVTHELKHLCCYDAVVVLIGGIVAFQGTPAEMASYFQTADPEEVFQRLSEVSAEEWGSFWRDCARNYERPSESEEAFQPESLAKQRGLARWMAQFFCLTRRRFRIFVRNKAQIFLQLLLLFVFPAIVVLFALKGLPEIQNMSLNLETNPAHMLKETLDYSSQVSRVGRLVSGLAMFQVILLALMGANNAAREIAAERGIFEKEKLSGLSTSAYLFSKILFLALLVMAQSLWMTVLVKEICKLPGDFWEQFTVLGLVNLSLTSLSLAISSWSKTAEQASLIALYVVGFQLPLSGAVLALPDWLATITRPFIAAYWSWSGYLQTLKETRLYDLVTFAGATTLDTWSLCVIVLIIQALVCLLIAFLGCYRSSLSD